MGQAAISGTSISEGALIVAEDRAGISAAHSGLHKHAGEIISYANAKEALLLK
jgi:hypothetical protein